MSRLAAFAAFLFLAGAPIAASAASIEAGRLDDTEVAPLAAEDLELQRGGFMTPLGFEIGLGAVLTATVDGVSVMQTHLHWTDTGVQTISGAPGPLDTDAASQGGINLGADASQLTGVIVPGKSEYGGGATAILQGLGANGITNAILNTANMRQVTTSTQITLEVPQSQLTMMSNEQLQSRIQDNLSLAIATAGLK